MCSSPHLPMHFTTPPQSQRPPRQLPLHGRPHPPLVHLHARWTRWHGRHSSLSLYVRHVWISPQDQHFLAPSRYKATSLSCPSRVRPARAPWPPRVLAHGGPRRRCKWRSPHGDAHGDPHHELLVGGPRPDLLAMEVLAMACSSKALVTTSSPEPLIMTSSPRPHRQEVLTSYNCAPR
jgi:hypothetical protein